MYLTNDLLNRYQERLEGKYADCYTFSRPPLKLKYYEIIPFLNDAVAIETQIKGWTRAKKEALITNNFHNLHYSHNVST